MNIDFSPYQIILLVLMLLWFIPLLTIWVRYDKLPHGQEILFAILIYPLLLLDDVIIHFGFQQSLSFALGLFRFTPLLMMALFFLAIRKMVQEEPKGKQVMLLPVLLLLAEVPFLLLPAEVKVQILQQPLIGNISSNWPLYAFFVGSSFLLLLLALKTERMVSDHQHYLSEQVVDINFYQMPFLGKALGVIISIAFGSILLVMLVAFDWLPFSQWLNSINVLQLCANWLLIMVLLEKRRYSPSPLNYDVLEKNKFSEEQLRLALARAEAAIIRYRAYKHIGLRLRHLANVAEVEPEVLAVATRTLLNRNFRAFIYHYRLEYAKKVLMRTDAKVSAVAKRLGFNSEKFLSDVFVKYVGKMADRVDDPGPDLPLDELVR